MAARQGRVPVRTCIGCRQSMPRADMLRLVADDQGQLWPDLGRKAPGRGGYLCMRPECLAAMSDRRLGALKAGMAVALPQWQLLKQRLADALEQYIGRELTRLRGRVDLGRDAVMHRLWNNTPLLLFCAEDAGSALRRQLETALEKRRAAGQPAERVDVESAAWLGRKFGRECVAVAAMDMSPAAKKLKQFCAWLGHVKVSG